MKVDMPYPIISFLRELVKTEQNRIWKSKWAPYIKKKDVYFPSIYNRVMGRKNILTKEGCCAIAQEIFEKAEKEVQVSLGMRK